MKTATGDAEGGRHTVWLAFGTNVGDRAGNLARALAAIEPHVAIDAISDVYETEPFGYTGQPVFWNLVVRGRTGLGPAELLGRLQQCERDVGRVPTFRMGPRIIDIDILLHDDTRMQTTQLTLPHPGLLERAFVLVPLLDIDPGLVHAGTGVRLADAAALLDSSGVRRIGAASAVLAGVTGGAP